jgi:hypothetical protein
VPDIEAGCCLGPEGNGVSSGEGGERGPNPPRGGKDEQSVLIMGRDNNGKDMEDRTSRAWWRRIGVNRVSGFLNKIGGIMKLWLLNLFWYRVFSFRRINHMALKNHLHWSSVYPLLYIMSRTLLHAFAQSLETEYKSWYFIDQSSFTVQNVWHCTDP